MNTSLYIGRFQPFHKGHLSVALTALKKCDYLIIGIGSAENHLEKDNPFTARERWEMISNTLDEKGISRDHYTIIPVRNINNYDLWVEHVSRLVPPFQSVYTGSKIVKKLFKNHGQYQVLDVDFVENITGTQVREAIKSDENWESLVPPTVAEYLKRNLNSIKKCL